MRFALWCAAWVLGGCGAGPIDGVLVDMEFERPSFFAAPFPSDDLRHADGIDLSEWPNPNRITFVARARRLAAEDSNGFGRTSGVFLRLSGAVGPGSLPALGETVSPRAAVSLIALDGDELRAHPVDVTFEADGGPFGDANLIALLPLQGLPLDTDRRYAAVVRRKLGGPERLGRSQTMADLLNGDRPSGMPRAAFESYLEAIDQLDEGGIGRNSISGLAVFTTGEPMADLVRARESARAVAPVAVDDLALTEVYQQYCVYQGRVAMPVFQAGTPPFEHGGGDWVLGADGAPELQGTEQARLVLTLPRTVEPDGGFPLVVFSRTGGGGDRPLVDRGRRDATGVTVEPGEGPARYFALAGYAGVSIDGPHGGLRNVTGGDEQFLMFNIANPAALRDNIRQSALELALVPDLLDHVIIDAQDCPGLVDSAVSIDARVLMGHSMGATIAPLAAAVEPRFRALLLSGAGGSWIENLTLKQLPLDTRALAELILGYTDTGRTLERHDPVLSLVQWAAESADPPVAGGALRDRHVLMMQGIVDHYILPPIANAATLSLRLDRVGPALDQAVDMRGFSDVAPFANLVQLEPPVSGNQDSRTAVVMQYAEDGVEDGHEVVFQRAEPKAHSQCFLETLRQGVPVVGAVCD